MEGMAEQSLPDFTIKINQEAKLKELLRNINSIESQLFSDACKEFIKVLKSDLGPEFIRSYVQRSSKLVEISQAWESRIGKPGFWNILNLVAAILKHWKDNVVGDDDVAIRRDLDKFAQVVIEEKMGDLYKELNSKEAKRQNAVLLLLASIVKRNSHLAWEMAKVFDFKLTCFPRLAEVRFKSKKPVDGTKKMFSTRKSFVSFSMSFLEVGNPRLLRGVLQQKEMYSGVLRGLGNDDEETVVYVLSILRDRVLVSESLVPPGLRSVLFGSITLEQLVSISGRDDFQDAAELAHHVLVMVCTDPVNGLMPDLDRRPSPLRGNAKRLLGLMKKLKATEVEYHKDLLLAIVKGRLSFGSAFLDEFPYNFEDLASDNWFAAISLAGDVISAVCDGVSFGFVDKPPAFESQHLQDILKCIAPRPFTRLLINKGLLHGDSLVKQGTLKLVVEVLGLFNSLVKTLDCTSRSNIHMMHSWEALKAEIQNGVRMMLPDPQVLLSLLSTLESHFRSVEYTAKRKAGTEIVQEHHVHGRKRLKSSATEELDIVISGVNSSEVDLSEDGRDKDLGSEQQPEGGYDIVKCIGDLWGLPHLEDVDTYFYSKILDSLKIYYRTMPMTKEGLSDLFKFLPKNPLALPTIVQRSLLELLNEHVNQFSKGVAPIRTPPQMYRHLYQCIILLMGSPVKQIKEHAYNLAKAAMLSTGAFDNNTNEICAWFFFLPGYSSNHVLLEDLEVEIFQKLSSDLVSFLCDAVSTIGNNLLKYMESLKNYMYDSGDGKDLSSGVSPFIICVLEKCLRLLGSESGSSTIPQKSLISLYVCNTIKYLLDTQVNVMSLSFLIDRVLSERLENYSSRIDVLDFPCEWRPLKTLLCFSRDILHQQHYSIYSDVEDIESSNSLIDTIRDVKEVLRSESDIGVVGLTLGFSFSLICTRHNELLQNFPSVLTISRQLLGAPFSVLSSILFLDSSYLIDVSKLWPEMFSAALDRVTYFKEKEVIFDKTDLDSTKAASDAFAHYLQNAPFCVLFSSIAKCNSLDLHQQQALLTLLVDKIAEMPADHLISALCNVLFWTDHARSCYNVRSSDALEMRSDICLILAEHLVKQLLIENMDTHSATDIKDCSKLPYAVEVAEIVFNHPAVTASVSCPLSGKQEFSDLVFGESLEKLLESAKHGVHTMDISVLTLIGTVSKFLFPACGDQISEQVINAGMRISRAFKALEQKLILAFKNKFDACVKSMDFKPLVPTFYALHTLIDSTSPFELLGLVNWLFTRIDFDDTTMHLLTKRNALSVGLHLASCVFDFLPTYMEQSYPACKLYALVGTETQFDVLLFERIFWQVLEIGFRYKLEIADICLLKAVKAIKMHNAGQHQHLPSIMVLSRVISTTPVNIFSYCFHKVNRIKAELLYIIAGMSPLHMSVFGFLFSEALDKSSLSNANDMQYTFSDEELVMVLPIVSLYLNSVISKFGGQLCKPFEVIKSVYGRVLLSGFSEWKIFVSGKTFEIGVVEPLIAEAEELSNLFSDNVLAQAILMVHDHLASSEDTTKLDGRLRIFNSVCPSSANDIFDYGTGETGLRSLKQPVEFVNRVVAKMNFCRILLFPNHSLSHSQLNNEDKEAVSLQVDSTTEKSRIHFLRMLVNSWILIVKKFSEKSSLFRFLEIFIMNNILDLTTEMHDSLIKLDSLPFVEQLVKSFLRYRFDDLVSLKMLRSVLTSLSHAKFSCASVIQLLLAHSQFAVSFHVARPSLVSTHFGMVFTPMRSILRSLVIPRTDLETTNCTSQLLLKLLELIKLVRILIRIYVQHREVNFGEDISINYKELVYLLLSSYGATCSEIDLEIYSLILEIESSDMSSAGTVAEMDYLWGIASLKARKDLEQGNDMEFFEEHRKIKFRENFPVDPKMCAQTVLYFPYNRSVSGGGLNEAQSITNERQIYDPCFILRFSIHCLSMGYVEPVEFATSGLLAVTFASMSSPDIDMRKLAYEALAKFKNALEKCRRRKDVVRLRLLISYLQNGIEEPWQRILSFIAVFIAESSMVLLDPSHDNYSTISKFLSNSPTVSMKAIPLFQNLFWSSSITFRADRFWMLRILYVGLNTEDDAQIYIRNGIFETLMSFYSSPLSDNDSKDLVTQIVMKAVKLQKAVWFLVEHCGLILWLSSIVSSLYGESHANKIFTITHLSIILEAVNHITSPRSILEWLQNHAMEQLSELSSHLYEFLVGNVEFIKEQSVMCNSILKILTLVLKLSQKRKTYQPRFTLSGEGLFQLYESIEVCSNSIGLGLEAILMSTPPVTILLMDQEKLMKFLRWAVSTAIQSKSKNVIQFEDSDYDSLAGRKQPEECLVLKLLRWLTASVILGKISCKLSKHDDGSFSERPNLHTLHSWLGKGLEENASHDSENVLAASIFYLLQLLGFSHGVLPSAVSAISLLLLSDSSSESEFQSDLEVSSSKIHCPAEANPSWIWSYYQPWRNPTMEINDVEKLDEIHACERLLVVASNALVSRSGGSHFFTLKDVEKLGVYEWERSLKQTG